MSEPAVLIVEDNDITRRHLSALFTRMGWDVRGAATATVGLALLEPPPECVILDLSLPDGTGERILSEIRDRGLPVRVVVVATAASDALRLGRVAQLKPDLLIQKPFDWEILGRYCETQVRRAPAAV